MLLHPAWEKIGRGLCTVLAILMITLLLLETVLQIAARFIDKHPQAQQWLHPGAVRIVALGDSNTFGLYLRADQAYPMLFEKQWNAHHPEKLVEVINLGFPGTNSSRLVKSLPDVISMFAPDIITVMVGVNDFWMAPVDTPSVATDTVDVAAWLREHSRVYKLFYLLKRQAYNATLLKVDSKYRDAKFNASPELTAQWTAAIHGQGPSPFSDEPHGIQYGDKQFDIGYVFDASKKEDLPGQMKANLERIAEMAQHERVQLVFITYAYFELPQKVANQQMKVASKEKSALLVNATRAFRDECDKGESRCHEMFFPDFHPSAAGHQLLADILEQNISTLLLSL